jgi:hypothetical protein
MLSASEKEGYFIDISILGLYLFCLKHHCFLSVIYIIIRATLFTAFVKYVLFAAGIIIPSIRYYFRTVQMFYFLIQNCYFSFNKLGMLLLHSGVCGECMLRPGNLWYLFLARHTWCWEEVTPQRSGNVQKVMLYNVVSRTTDGASHRE